MQPDVRILQRAYGCNRNFADDAVTGCSQMLNWGNPVKPVLLDPRPAKLAGFYNVVPGMSLW